MDQDLEKQPVNQQETETKQPETLAEKIARLKHEKEEKEKAEKEALAAQAEQEKASKAESIQAEKAQLEQEIANMEGLRQEVTALQEEVGNAEKNIQAQIDSGAEVLSEMGINTPQDMASNPDFQDSPEVASWLQKQSELEQKNQELTVAVEGKNLDAMQSRLAEINQELNNFEQEEKAKEASAKQEQINKIAQEFPTDRPLGKAKEMLLSGAYEDSMIKEAYLESIRMNMESQKQNAIKDNPAESSGLESKYNTYLEQDLRKAEKEWDILVSDLFEEQNNKDIENYTAKVAAKNESQYLTQTLNEFKLDKAFSLEDPVIKEARLFTKDGEIEINLDLPRLALELRDKEAEIKKAEDSMVARENQHRNYTVKLMDRGYDADMARLTSEKQQLEAQKTALITEYNRRNDAKHAIDRQLSRLGSTSRDWVKSNMVQMSFSEILSGLENKAEEDSRFSPTEEEKNQMTDKINKRLDFRKKAGKSTY